MIHELRILADTEKKTVTLLDDKGNAVDLPGVIVFGGDALLCARFCWAFGSSADMAWAAAQTYGMDSPGMRTFWRQLGAHIAQAIDPLAFQQMIDAGQAIAMWGEQGKETSH